MKRAFFLPIGILASSVVLVGSAAFVVRAEEPADATNNLQSQINDREVRLEQVNRRINEYRTRIDQLQKTADSLAVEIDLFDNRIALANLDIEANHAEIDTVTDQIQILEMRIHGYEAELAKERALLSDILRHIQSYDNDVSLELIFGSDSFSELFGRLSQLETMNTELSESLQSAMRAKREVETSRMEEEGHRESLLSLQDELLRNQSQLEAERGAKESLLVTSRNSESQYRSLVTELRQESNAIGYEVTQLQEEIEAKLKNTDLGDTSSSVMSWPVDPSYRGISTYFHDPTYPFRNLFEHSGLDIPQPHGTPIGAAAPGYVAWTRSGSSYGNYIMIIHANGVATLYAHLSKVMVVADQFVARGETIGLSGGTPGTSGAGLSTGAHLHFEVREDGIPVDPLGYLTDY